MITKKGQGAMEYLMTYGWAILVVIIVGVVLWQMGIFNPSGGTAPGMSGFGSIRPNEWACNAGTNAVNLVVVNTVGQGITLDDTTTTLCGLAANTTVAAGDTVVCTIDSADIAADTDCETVDAGSRYEATVSLGYTTGSGLARTSTGTVWGAAE